MDRGGQRIVNWSVGFWLETGDRLSLEFGAANRKGQESTLAFAGWRAFPHNTPEAKNSAGLFAQNPRLDTVTVTRSVVVNGGGTLRPYALNGTDKGSPCPLDLNANSSCVHPGLLWFDPISRGGRTATGSKGWDYSSAPVRIPLSPSLSATPIFQKNLALGLLPPSFAVVAPGQGTQPTRSCRATGSPGANAVCSSRFLKRARV